MCIAADMSAVLANIGLFKITIQMLRLKPY